MGANGTKREVTARGHLVLGATGGIGSALCRRLRARGDQVFLAARDEERLEALAGELDAPWRSVDARDLDAVEALVEQAAGELGRLDGAVCAVGSMLLKPAHRTSEAAWEETIGQNLRSAFALVRAAAPVLARQDDGGSIVLLASAAARFGLPNHEAIAAAKGGVIGLARAAAAGHAARGVRVNTVAPGLVDTPLSASLLRSDVQREASEAMHPLGRIGRPQDVASAIAWLLDAEQSWVTGQVIGVDGGLASLQARSAVPRKRG